LKNQKAKKAQKKRKNQDGDGNDKKRGAKVKDKSAPKVTRTAFAFFQQHVRSASSPSDSRHRRTSGESRQSAGYVKDGRSLGCCSTTSASRRTSVCTSSTSIATNADSAKYKNNDYVGAIKEATTTTTMTALMRKQPERRQFGDDNSDDASVESISSDDSS
jgi:hypothetical protein